MCPIVDCAQHLCLRDLCQLILSMKYLRESISDMSRAGDKSAHETVMAVSNSLVNVSVT